MARECTEPMNLLRRTFAVLMLTAVCEAMPSQHDGEFLVGGDISALTRIEQAGGVFRDAGDPGDAIEIMSRYGCNCFRLRLFVNLTNKNLVVNDLAYIIGLSYYPWWHGSMEDLRENLSKTAATFDKDIFIVETAYPHRSARVSKAQEGADKNMRWPMTPAGQEAFLRELITTVRETSGDRGIGVLWWYPESIPVKGLRIWYGGANAMFDSEGNALPSMNAFQEVAHKPKAKIDFSQLTSPIIFRGDQKYGFRDPAVVYHDGVFYLYFTLSETAADGGYYNMTAYSASSDLIHWTFPEIITPRDRNLNHSSPGNIIRFDGKWIICLQTYPTPNMETFGTSDSRIWIRRSDDLKNWSEPELLRVKGSNVPREDMGRMIDPYLLADAQEESKWWCFYKQNGASMSYSYDLKNWTYVGRASAGENVTVIRRDSEYVMFHSPANGIGIKRSKEPASWGQDVQLLTLGQKQWPWAQGRMTAATVIDLTEEPSVGKYIMFFHGSSKEGLKAHRAHGRASLAIAWSDDLINWTWPGNY